MALLQVRHLYAFRNNVLRGGCCKPPLFRGYIVDMGLSSLFIFFLGLIFGSFLTALTHRVVHGVSINKGRSFCPNCKKQIEARDNIPLLSYLLLKGKCRNCGKKISVRYPLIELATGITFVVVWLFYFNCGTASNVFVGGMCWWKASVGLYALLMSLFVSLMLIAIFIIDLEERIIPDNLVFLSSAVILLSLLFGAHEYFFEFLLSGLLAGVFILFLHLITKGKGMGLGDVKLAFMGGILVGWRLSILWLFLAFLTGALVGIILILLGRAKFGKHIPFGPFMAVTLLISYLVGPSIISLWIGTL